MYAGPVYRARLLLPIITGGEGMIHFCLIFYIRMFIRTSSFNWVKLKRLNFYICHFPANEASQKDDDILFTEPPCNAFVVNELHQNVLFFTLLAINILAEF